jgi:hypothetical protein
MKRRFVDPFFPNRPVDDPLRFAGRRDQVEEVIDSLFQILNGNPKHSIITGDRGIGKSSLLLQTKLLASGDNRLADKLSLDLGVERYKFATAWHDCDKEQTVQGLIGGLTRELESGLRNFLGKLDFKLNVFSTLEVSKKDSSFECISEIVNAFVDDVREAHERLTSKGYNGIIFFIDELDRVDPSSGVASFFKLASERMAREGYKNIAFIAAGISGAIQKLEEEHASVVRTFRDIPIPRWEAQEGKELLISGFKTVQATYDEQVCERAYNLSAGFPEPLHLLGSEILSVDADDYLDLNDLEAARKKVVRDVRKNKFESLLKLAGSGKYQRILEAMADYDGPNVPLIFISGKIHLAQNQYSINMSTLLDRGIINRLDKGVYGFVDPLLKEYIREFGIISISTDEKD